jgi:hypothetical protein
MTTRSSNLFSRPLHGLNLGSAPIPEINRWAIFKPSAKRGLSGTISLGIAEGLRLSEPKVLILLAGGSAFSGLFVRSDTESQRFCAIRRRQSRTHFGERGNWNNDRTS